MPEKLTPAQAAEAIASLPGWSAADDDLRKTFKFPDHITAVGFVVRLAMAAEVMDHHPDCRLVYNRVELTLSSHDAGGVTTRDVELAKKADQLSQTP